jgi:hypothetical protein
MSTHRRHLPHQTWQMSVSVNCHSQFVGAAGQELSAAMGGPSSFGEFHIVLKVGLNSMECVNRGQQTKWNNRVLKDYCSGPVRRLSANHQKRDAVVTTLFDDTVEGWGHSECNGRLIAWPLPLNLSFVPFHCTWVLFESVVSSDSRTCKLLCFCLQFNSEYSGFVLTRSMPRTTFLGKTKYIGCFCIAISKQNFM